MLGLFIKETVKSESKVWIESQVWICLFTCCVTRAIHVDTVNNLSVDCFLSFFVARRGFPGAAVILPKIVKHPDVSRYFSDLNVSWAFNVAKAPLWGGIFERLMQSVKRCLEEDYQKSQVNS